MALVTDISGECNAGATPQTTRYPTSPASPNVKKLSMNAAPVALPSATAVPIPAVTVATSVVAFFHGVIASDIAFSSLFAVGGGTVGAGATRGTGFRCVPWCTTRDPQ